MLEHLKLHLKGEVVILGIGNTLRNDDGFGSILADRIKDKLPYKVYDSGTSPENYLGKIIKDAPDNIVIIDTLDSGANPGEVRVLEADELKSVNLFSTHNSSLYLVINYLQSHIEANIIILTVQPKTIAFGDKLSQEVSHTLDNLEDWFLRLSSSINP